MIDIKNKKILFFSTDIVDLKLAKFFKKNGLEIICFHTNLLSYFLGKFIFKKNLISIKNKKIKYDSKIKEKAYKNFGYLSQRLSLDECVECYYSTISSLESFFIEEDYCFFIPSGRHMHHEAAKDYAEIHNIRCLYLNYSNIPGYIFLDPKGTDAKSLVYKNPNILDKYDIDNINANQIILKFKTIKNNQSKLPQSKKNSYIKIVNYLFILERYLQFFFNTCSDRKIKKKYKFISNDFNHEYLSEIRHKNFAFFPLQITTDVQVLENYEKRSVYSAIEDALIIAKKRGLPLYIKENPAENDKYTINKYLKNLLDNNKSEVFLIREVKVSNIIEKADLVITINSTVGLESLLWGKETIFLGKSMYAKFNRIQLAKYLNNYLVEFDYHKPTKIQNLVEKLNFYINLECT